MGRGPNKFTKDNLISDAAKAWNYKDKAKQLHELTDVLHFYVIVQAW